jgi:hypothetical protein
MLRWRPPSQRPHWTQAYELCGDAGLDAFTDNQSEGYVLIAVKLDGCAACATEHHALDLAAVAVEEHAMDTAWLVSDDVSEQCHHGWGKGALGRGVKSGHIPGYLVRKAETAHLGEITLDQGATRITRLVPDRKSAVNAAGLIVIRLHCRNTHPRACVAAADWSPLP